VRILYAVLTGLAHGLCRLGYWLHRLVPNRKRLVLLGVLLTAGAAKAVVIGPGETYQPNDLLGGVVKLPSSGTTSGVALTRLHILTARHVSTPGSVEYPGGVRIAVAGRVNHPTRDLAILTLAEPGPHPGYPVAEAHQGDVVLVAGYGRGGEGAPTLGKGTLRAAMNVVSHVATGSTYSMLYLRFNVPGDAEYVVGEGSAADGDSGGPVFLYDTMSLVSITSAGVNANGNGVFPDPGDYTLHTHLHPCNEWIQANTPEPGTIGLVSAGLMLCVAWFCFAGREGCA